MVPREIIEKVKIVPVVKIDDVNNTMPLMNALCEGGIPIAEITFRTACAAEAIRIASENFGDKMLVGAGTVVNASQAKIAIENGAKFIVSPGFGKDISDVCVQNNIAYVPGCVTPTEIMQALELGITVIKFFPSHIYGGLKAMKALSGPFPQVKFIPTGGVDKNNIDEYLAWDKIYAVGGSSFVKEALENLEEK